MSDLATLVSLCKCGVHVTVNRHRDFYEPIEKFLESGRGTDFSDMTDDVRREMVARDTLIEVQFYMDTPIGFYLVYHFDVDAALAEAVKIARADRGVQ